MIRFLLFLGFSILATAVCAADRPINFFSWGDAAQVAQQSSMSPWENEGFEATWGVRLNAAKALASMDDLSGVPVLIELLDSDLALVRDYAQRLLGQITGRRFGKDDQTGRH